MFIIIRLGLFTLLKLKNYIIMSYYSIKNFIRVLVKFCFVLLCLIGIEGMITFGYCFDFEQYNWFGWFVQVLLVIICLHITLIEWK